MASLLYLETQVVSRRACCMGRVKRPRGKGQLRRLGFIACHLISVTLYSTVRMPCPRKGGETRGDVTNAHGSLCFPRSIGPRCRMNGRSPEPQHYGQLQIKTTITNTLMHGYVTIIETSKSSPTTPLLRQAKPQDPADTPMNPTIYSLA